jgi:hypothetical protein
MQDPELEQSISGSIFEKDVVFGTGKKTVVLMLNGAKTTCQCGKELMLKQTNDFGPIYRGECVCGLVLKLRNNELFIEVL